MHQRTMPSRSNRLGQPQRLLVHRKRLAMLAVALMDLAEHDQRHRQVIEEAGGKKLLAHLAIRFPVTDVITNTVAFTMSPRWRRRGHHGWTV